ncbi:multidrug effflux MFS transporter [Bacillus horti]|uniref:Bcr/CflA family efflux transporter n=1 Tax=Caldalkalibacillus horti TaxID=77523 RepID=A0ABT9W039_9BACI|nr:multidrug effflux MFS transporter [Bacillus horti]MDQ0166230.1 DHA1 family bicyclomycin/chloramphenicol resistance-like MFS transporter [Bacillus horti]
MAETVTGKRRLALALLLGSLAAFGPLTIDMYLPSFPTLTQDLNTSASLVQLSLTACLLGLGVGQLVMGPLSDIKGRKKPLLIALGLYLVSSLICAFAQDIWTLITGRFLQGFTASAGIVISRAVVRDLFNGVQLTKFFALLMLINGLAPILAPVIGGGILYFTNWQGIFMLLGATGGLMLFIVLGTLKETLPPDKRTPSSLGQTIGSFISLLKDRTFTGFALTQGFKMAGIFAYVAGTPFVYQSVYGVSPQAFSLLFGLNGIGLIAGTQIVGRYAGQIPERTLLQTGLVISTLSGLFLFIMTLVGGPLYSIAIPLFLIVFSVGMVATSSFSLAMETQGHRAGSAAALLGLLPFVLGAMAAPLVGIAGEGTAVPMGTVIFIANALAFLSFYFLVKKKAEAMNS